MLSSTGDDQRSCVAWPAKLKSPVKIFYDIADAANLIWLDSFGVELNFSELRHRYYSKRILPVMVVNEICFFILSELKVEHMPMDEFIYSLVESRVRKFITAAW